MKAKHYIEIDASKELPKKDKIYFVIDEYGLIFSDRFSQEKWYSDPIHQIKYWLKEVPSKQITEEDTIYIKCEPEEADFVVKDLDEQRHFNIRRKSDIKIARKYPPLYLKVLQLSILSSKQITEEEIEKIIVDNFEGSVGRDGIRVHLDPKRIAKAIISELTKPD